MPKRIAHRLNRALEQRFPEKRLYLKTDTETRFVRLRPATQLAGIAGGAALLVWAIVATSILMIDTLGVGSTREQARRDQAIYERRIEALAHERDERAEEARNAQDRFNLALSRVSQMQSLLLESEETRREMETGLDVVQKTLRRTIRERDTARADKAALELALAEQGPEGGPQRAREVEATLEFLSEALEVTATERDLMAGAALQARDEVAELEIERRLTAERNDDIFARLEEAVTVSMEPLDRMFRAAGLQPDEVLRQVRRGYSGTGGPVTPLRISTSGNPDITAEEMRANAVLNGLDRMNLYRLAASKVPFANPVRGSYRFTSGFGYRRDPKGAGRRMHAGTDFAGAHGTPIHSTADGVVTHAGWQSGYGNLVTIRHEFGIETRYAHLSQIRVSSGQRVSRGDRIGDMGNTGRSTGTHLHYEVRVGGNPVNPMTYIEAARNVF
ncbi:MAG: M23 family metallopeptidase [Gemmobacter sp.]